MSFIQQTHKKIQELKQRNPSIIPDDKERDPFQEIFERKKSIFLIRSINK